MLTEIDSAVSSSRPVATLCIGGAEFWSNLKRDIAGAERYVYVQTLSFEGDRAGRALADALKASLAPDRRIIADSVTKHVINDRIIHLPRARRDPALRSEVRQSHEMFAELQRASVPIRFTWPIGRRLHRLIVRNHKKLVAIDDRIAYVGGINFSEHNFMWHDVMARIESPQLCRFLRHDFLHTWHGRDAESTGAADGFEIVIGNGQGNQDMRRVVGRVVNDARHYIVLQCPYVSEPFWKLLGLARRRGVRVIMLMPEYSNRAIMKWGTLAAARRYGFDVLFLPGVMTHQKTLLADETLVLGSANFDFVSFKLQPEIVLVTRRPDVVAEFRTRVLDPDIDRARGRNADENRALLERLAMWGMRIAEPIAWWTRERTHPVDRPPRDNARVRPRWGVTPRK